MRINAPVTQHEYALPEDATLMSTTDANSFIKYANAAFVEASGFSRDEIEHQPHNLVRHPDMPESAFADMWATLKAGEPWTGLVKNRRKNGDYYWVRANAMPIIRNGVTTGYMSVRTTPSREEVAVAEQAYESIRQGNISGLKFYKGLLTRKGIEEWRSVYQRMSVRWRIRSALIFITALNIGATTLLRIPEADAAGFAALLIVVAGSVSFWLESQIAKPIEAMKAQALSVASGDSRQVKQTDRVDEIGVTLRAIGQLGLMFRWLVDDVSEQVMELKRAAEEIYKDNGEISERTRQAAGSVEQTASSVVGITETVASNATNAQDANLLADATCDAALAGGSAMTEVVSTMDAIAERSGKIGGFIGMIDSIAFQTNILALNASVEAARAGDQGKGFAVVAGEVRALAQRSGSAAREIRTLIAASAESVESGSHLVREAGRTMDGIVDKVKKVSSMICDISLANAQQADGVAQIGCEFAQLDRITQAVSSLRCNTSS